jgi:DNA-binding MarR family transcriptional regulator
MQTPPLAALDADLGWALGVVYRSYIKAVEAVVNDLPGGPRGYQVLAAAVHDVADNQAVLATRVGIDRTVLTYLIDDLEECGLVERRSDPQDRRSRRIAATDKGTTVWRQRQQALEHVERHVLSPLGEDAETFRKLLRRLAAHANEFDPVASACEIVDQLKRLDDKPNSRARRRQR